MAAKKRTQRTPGECPWYKKADLIRLFDRCDRTVEKWVAMKRLPEPVRRGRTWVRWPKEQIDALIREWKAGAA